MSYLALYRKYRPDTFEKVIGQDHIVKVLTNQIETGRIGHAYLFTGTRGTGKTSVAKIFSKAINCLHPKNGSPCGECEVCKALNGNNNVDVIEIDAASNNGVNEIRDLREKVQYAPSNGKYKVYIIDEVHMLTGAAFNALLKTLEEPPKHAVFILATTEAYKIPATILSRCMRFDFRLVSTEVIAKQIAKIYDEMGIKYQQEAVFAIASAGEGSVRDALSIADTAISFSDGVLSYEDVMEILGSSNFSLLEELIKNIITGNVGEVLNVLDKLCSIGKSMGVLCRELTGFIRDLIVVKSCENANEILKLPDVRFNKLSSLSKTVNTDRLIRILEVFSACENDLKYTTHQRLTFESSAIKASRPEKDYDIDALLSRIKTLEEKIENQKVVTVYQESAKGEQKEQSEIKQEVTEKISEEFKEGKVQSVKKNLNEYTNAEIFGKLLTNLRKDGHEMLWNVMQSVKTEIRGNIFIIYALNSVDVEILDRADNREYIENALEEFMPFSLQIKDGSNDKFQEKIEEDTESIKKIFGDDIVIIKD